MTKNISQTKNQQKCGQPASCYYDYQLMDTDEQRFIEHVLTTINTKGYMPA